MQTTKEVSQSVAGAVVSRLEGHATRQLLFALEKSFRCKIPDTHQLGAGFAG